MTPSKEERSDQLSYFLMEKWLNTAVIYEAKVKLAPLSKSSFFADADITNSKAAKIMTSGSSAVAGREGWGWS